MGIRPSFTIIVGIDTAKSDDVRHKEIDPEWLEEILYYRELTGDELWTNEDFSDAHYADLKIPGYTRRLCQKIYNPELSDEYYPGNVIGYIIHKGPYDDGIIRALATFDPSFEQTGYKRIPVTYDIDKTSYRWRYYEYNDQDILCNRVVPEIFESMPKISRMEWQRAIHYLKLIGWEIPEEELRYILVWTWS